jgi:hypothetical protein
MAPQLDPTLRDPEITELTRLLLDRRAEMIDGMVARIQAEIDFYRTGTVDRQDLWESCEQNIEFVLGPFATGKPIDLASPRETGRRRAAQRAPLPAVMAAYRIGFRYVWDEAVAAARQRGLAASEALVNAASVLWATNDAYTDAMTTAYRDAMATEMVRNERERSALVEAVLEGRIADTTAIWDVADMLRLPTNGTYVVVAAEVPGLAREALPGAEARLFAEGFPSAWCLLPELQVGIACARDPKRLDALVSTLRAITTGRVGVSPPYPALDETAQALRLARIALAATRAGGAEVTLFDAAPLAVTAVSASDVLSRVTRTVLGSLLDMPADERTILLETLEAWRDNNGSATEAGAALYCHPNTIRHRLRRVEERTGRSLADPRAVAELCLALEAVRLLPEYDTPRPASDGEVVGA